MTRVHVLDPKQVEALARRAAGWLRARGLGDGDRVAIAAPSDPRVLALAHGALRSGIVPVLMSPELPAEDRAWIVRDAEPGATVEDLDAIPWDEAPEEDLASLPLGRPMLYTSGTTGRRKGVWCGVFSEERAEGWADDEWDLWAPDPPNPFLVCSPLYQSAAYRSATAAITAGAPVLLLERFDAETVVRTLASEPVTGAFFVPTHLRRIQALGEVAPSRAAKRVLHAGEPCPEPVKRWAMRWLPDALWEFYGSTEGQFTAISPAEWIDRPGSVGRARRGRRLEILDPDEDGVGKVFVSAPSFARWEYWRDPERTAPAWRGDSFTVGDLGRLDPDGYLYLVARREDLVISGGVNVYPAEVERVLLEHPGVHEAAVFGIPDPEWGQRVCAAVTGVATEREVEAWARAHLEGPRRPKSLIIVDALPRTASGKVRRDELKEL